MSARAIPPEQVFSMWKLKWFKAKPDLERLFRDRPELRDKFLLRKEVADLSKMSRKTVRQAINVGHLLADILKEAERLEAVRSANQKATATARSKQKKKRKKQRPPVESKGPVRPGYNDRDMSKITQSPPVGRPYSEHERRCHSCGGLQPCHCGVGTTGNRPSS